MTLSQHCKDFRPSDPFSLPPLIAVEVARDLLYHITLDKNCYFTKNSEIQHTDKQSQNVCFKIKFKFLLSCCYQRLRGKFNFIKSLYPRSFLGSSEGKQWGQISSDNGQTRFLPFLQLICYPVVRKGWRWFVPCCAADIFLYYVAALQQSLMRL